MNANQNPLSHDTSSGIGGLLGVAAVALVAMGLLAFGYNQNKTVDVAQAPPAATASSTPLNSSQTTGAAAGFKSPDTPKPYQPMTPAPDVRDAPTSSSAGQGNESGGRPENQAK